MNIWVRSQNKNFFGKVERVTIYSQSANKYSIYGNGLDWLGDYSSEERCIEIIDDIQEKSKMSELIIFNNIDLSPEACEYLKPFKGVLIHDNSSNAGTAKYSADVIYDMPKE